MELKIGCDVGNYDTKTQLTITESSFAVYEQEPCMANEYLYFEGKYYVPTTERNHQEQDKTVNDYATIMEIFGMAKEILAQTLNNCMTAETMQKKVSEVTSIRLGIGLPVGFFSKYAKATLAYTEDRFKNGIVFDYKSVKYRNLLFHYDLKVDKVRIFPQDVISVIKNPDLNVPRKYEDYNIIGFGGNTLDVIPIRNRMPRVDDVVSLESGTTQMYSEIMKKFQQNGYTAAKEYQIIEKVIRGDVTLLDKESRKAEKTLILDTARAYSDRMVNELIHKKVNFSDYPTVFIGGGALLLREFLESNPAFAELEFVKSVNENAVYYAKAV